MKTKILEIFGWYGTVAIVGAYALVSFSIIDSKSLPYQILNITGAVGIASDSLSKKDYQPGVLNIIWTLIAAAAIIKIFLG